MSLLAVLLILASRMVISAFPTISSHDALLVTNSSTGFRQDLTSQTYSPAELMPVAGPLRQKRASLERWAHGWTLITQPGPYFLPMETSARFLVPFFEHTMAAVAAKMLSDSPLSGSFWVAYNPVIFEIVPLTRSMDMDWNMIFYLTQFMRNRVSRGNTGTGNIVFTHASGIAIRVTIRLVKGYGMIIPMPCSYKC